MFNHDLDRMPRVTTRPDALLFERFYDSAGKLDFITTPTGTYDYQYFGLTPCPGCAPGRLSRITSPTGVNLDLTYDGQLVKSTTWWGAISGAVSFTYDTDFRVATETVTAGTTSSVIRYGYDADSLLICASPTRARLRAATRCRSPSRATSHASTKPTSAPPPKRAPTTASASSRRSRAPMARHALQRSDAHHERPARRARPHRDARRNHPERHRDLAVRL